MLEVYHSAMDLRKRTPVDTAFVLEYRDRIMDLIGDFGLKMVDVGVVYYGPGGIRDAGSLVRWFRNSDGGNRYSALLRLHLATIVTIHSGQGRAAAPIPTIRHPDGGWSAAQPPVAFVHQLQGGAATTAPWSICDTATRTYLADTRHLFATMLKDCGYTANNLVRQLGYRGRTAQLLTDPMNPAPWNYRLHQLHAVARSVGCDFTIR